LNLLKEDESTENWRINSAYCILGRLSLAQAAIEKVKEGEKLVAASKISPSEKASMSKRASTMSYALQGIVTYLH